MWNNFRVSFIFLPHPLFLVAHKYLSRAYLPNNHSFSFLSNLALCVNPDMKYLKLRDIESGCLYFIAEERLVQLYPVMATKKWKPAMVCLHFPISYLPAKTHL